MTAYLVPLVLIGGLTSVGVYLLLERRPDANAVGALAGRQRRQPA